MDVQTPPPFMVIDVASPSWARLCDNASAYDAFMGWLIEEGFDPYAMSKIEIFDQDSPLAESPVWAIVTDSVSIRRLEALGTCPPMPVRMIVGVYPQGERVASGKSDILFKNGQADDPAPPFPSLSPREKEAGEPTIEALEAAMQNTQLAHFAYRAYAIGHGAIDLFGEPMFQWEDLTDCCRRAWETAAAAMAAEVLGEQVVREQVTAGAAAVEALGVIEAALAALPERCPYHGTNTAPRGYPYPWTRNACCGTGAPAERRKQAEAALAKLREILADV